MQDKGHVIFKRRVKLSSRRPIFAQSEQERRLEEIPCPACGAVNDYCLVSEERFIVPTSSFGIVRNIDEIYASMVDVKVVYSHGLNCLNCGYTTQLYADAKYAEIEWANPQSGSLCKCCVNATLSRCSACKDNSIKGGT